MSFDNRVGEKIEAKQSKFEIIEGKLMISKLVIRKIDFLDMKTSAVNSNNTSSSYEFQ